MRSDFFAVPSFKLYFAIESTSQVNSRLSPIPPIALAFTLLACPSQKADPLAAKGNLETPGQSCFHAIQERGGSAHETLLCLQETPEAEWPELVELGLRQKGGSELDRAYLEHYGALAAQNRGDFSEAFLLSRHASKIFAQNGKKEWQAASLQNQGVMASALGRGREALALLEEALTLRRTIGDKEAEAAIETQIGWVFFLLKDRSTAIEHLQKALSLRSTPFGRAVTLDRLGSAYRDSGRPAEALAAYREALKIFDSLETPLRGHVLANLGWLQLDLGNDKGRAELLASLPLLQQVGDKGAEAHVLAGLSRAAQLEGDLEEALQYLEESLVLVEELRREAGSRSLSAAFLALRQDYFTRQVDLLVALNRKYPGHGYDRRAFNADERRRARSLLAQLVRGPRNLAAHDQESLALFEGFRTDFTKFESRLRQGLSSEERRAAEHDLLLKINEYEMLQAANVDLAAPVSADEQVKLADVQQDLDDHTTILSYSLGIDRGYLFLIDRLHFEIFDLPSSSEIEVAADDYYQLIASSNDPMSADQASVVGSELTRLLLAPLAGRLHDHLIIVKDGSLHRVPFGALPAPDGRPMIEHHEIKVVPSISILRLLKRRSANRKYSHTVALIAPDAAEGRNAAGSPFPPLRSVPKEIRSILGRVPPEKARALLGRAANRSNVANAGLENFRIVHFATHAFLSRDFPELSAILLSDGEGGDDLLRLQEVFDLSLPVDLVVLSACETALGDLLRGEGMVNMTHGFLNAGAQGVIVSLWRVDDQATAELMEQFYAGLLDHRQEPATALRSAQLAVRIEAGGRWSAPYYWAAFELQGN